MNTRLLWGLCCGTFLLWGTAEAVVTIVECRDEAGNSFYSETCPPGSAKVSEKKLQGRGKGEATPLAEVAASWPVTLYGAPKCDACDLMRLVLQRRGIPFTEKDVSNNPQNQAELQGVAGMLSVPTVAVGSSVITGYNRIALDNALDQVGYPPAPASEEEAAAQAAPPAATAAPATEVQEGAAAPPPAEGAAPAEEQPADTAGSAEKEVEVRNGEAGNAD